MYWPIQKLLGERKGKSSLGAPKKNGAGFGSRMALHVEGVDFDIAKEGFLHNHSKCIEQQQQYQWDSYFSQHIILHGYDTNIKEEIPEYNFKDMDDKSRNIWDELKEIPLEELSDFLECSTQWRPSITILHYLHRLCHGVSKL